MIAVANRYDFDAAVDEIAARRERKKCPYYIERAFIAASDKGGFCDLKQELRDKLDKDIGRFSDKLCANAELFGRPNKLQKRQLQKH